ncbi:HAD family hydrolase [Frondihabitans australicus]|uniref:Phosphoglycolate phosphatase-like HAD superfamily hydrolase n=1 Tax=Frondihabitans australicus TaxID=386892 RepID=A0A495IGZ1_9MICO|nr:HAD family hydrolase [Frondihabitans australicus]RKR74581.1 phosphoglycolate phosphatase-like HAD superfamily hydrolase [Frondihabitans australicus]
MQKPLAVLFDIDETLVHTGGAGGRSWTAAFDELYGVKADIGAHSSAGETDPQVGRATFSGYLDREPTDEEMAELYARYLWHLGDEIGKPGYRVFDGVHETLAALQKARVVVGIISGAMEGAARTKLERGGLGRYFVFGGYGSDSPDRDEATRLAVHKASLLVGHALAPHEVMVVGDTPHDIASAHAAGATGVGVATGHYSVDELRGAGADAVLSDLTQAFPGV